MLRHSPIIGFYLKLRFLQNIPWGQNQSGPKPTPKPSSLTISCISILGLSVCMVYASNKMLRHSPIIGFYLKLRFFFTKYSLGPKPIGANWGQSQPQNHLV